MKKLLFASALLFVACKKENKTIKTMWVTYYSYTHLGFGQKMCVQYMANYDTWKNQYGILVTDTISTDSFSVQVTYRVDDPNMKGLAGYLQAAVVECPVGGRPYINSRAQVQWVEAVANGTHYYNNAWAPQGFIKTSVNW